MAQLKKSCSVIPSFFQRHTSNLIKEGVLAKTDVDFEDREGNAVVRTSQVYCSSEEGPSLPVRVT